ncbi:alkaline phosphatase D family protein [Candidatus Nitrotoga fabula]|uniref:Alkaline phosphatase n=1 Tax=Candidatus Nitrotoga fabula TaxID=2182327 RepID=A0A916FCT2_9PROT|nr:alkaline phosphatase D family protein [Candidatus Nitrotoga fabula]CAE6739346.1 putative Alkaline phosphatase [Candidatus Nitrotoga fabula]
MSTLRKPALGPIVGHTTHKSCRLWISASEALDDKNSAQDRRTIGIIGIVGKNGKVKPPDIFYFRLHREYDRSGTFNLGADVSIGMAASEELKVQPYRLEPATTYWVRMASLSLDDAYPDDSNVDDASIISKLPPPKAWADKLNLPRGLEDAFSEAIFTTQPAPPDSVSVMPLSFLLGSCRYPGLLWKRKEADRIFGPMLKEALQEHLPEGARRPVNFTLMVGDQIYADMFNRLVPIGLADTYEEFQERYHTAFGSRNMRAFLSRVPTYMILDDHEIEDNWTQDRLHQSRKNRSLFNVAIGAYMSYQWSHGPRFKDSYVHSLPAGEGEFLKRMQTLNLFYDFSCSGYPFFVLDTRTQRYKQEDGLDDNHLLGKPALHEAEPSQLNRLCAWLRHMGQMRNNAPKFIVTSSVFLPNGVDEREGKNPGDSDSWAAFPKTRDAVLKTIVENRIENVVFLSGDIHCSCISKLEFSGKGEGLTAYSIVSSAFYWPFSFADGDPAGYVHDSQDIRTRDEFELSGGLGKMNYKAWAFTQDDNFCRIDVEPGTAELVVQMFDWDGAPVETRKQNDAYNHLPERLKLARWA